MAPVCSPLVVVSGGSAWNARKRKFRASTMYRLGLPAEPEAATAEVDLEADVDTDVAAPGAVSVSSADVSSDIGTARAVYDTMVPHCRGLVSLASPALPASPPWASGRRAFSRC